MQETKSKQIVITSFKRLIDYDNEKENQDILEHSWELMKELSKKYKIVIGIHPEHLTFAKKHCDTIWDTLHGAKDKP